MTALKLPADIETTVASALAEDIGAGDLTANLIAVDARIQARIITREDAVFCGTAWCHEVFRQRDKNIQLAWHTQDGAAIHAGQTLCRLQGSARALLTGERTALNFLQLLSGVATRTQQYVAAVRGTQAVILDTRKTLPGLRLAQKYAVACGGGQNHRLGLYDAVLIKENHIAAAGSISAALRATQALVSKDIRVEIEVENLDQLEQALAAGARHLLLDNFNLETLSAAVATARGRAKLEASGGVSLENIRRIAETGVDYISIGDLTKNIKAVDLSMRFES